MSDVTVDASELTAFGRRVAAAHAMASVKVAQAVKKGAQNVKEGVISDLQTSSNYAISRIGIGYEMGSTGTTIYADVSPRDGGASDLANIAFFGTAKGGGTHWFYQFAEQELPTLAEYVGDAADDLLPSMPSGVKIYRQEEPLESEMPPWIIARVSTDRHVAAETMRFTAHSALLEVRAVSTTADSVNIWCDDMLIPALANRSPTRPPGYTVGQLTLYEDSGAYAAGLTADDTARRYQVRVLRFRFTWSRP